ncbi:DUF177 domain-containing protein [Candidatus Sumerlaeota bacterium]|nr:DUF177 domain-containing protein [Candidatus Sumerlaeota bacterium]
MKIDVQNLHSGPVTITLDHTSRYFDLGGEDYQVVDNIRGELTFSLIRDKVLMQGILQTHIRMDCIRCLEPVDLYIKKDVTLYYIHKSEEKGKEDVINLEGIESSYYQGLIIVPDNDIRELILVELPDYPYCKEDCKGLCPTCGKNLNTGSCSCQKEGKNSFPEGDSWKNTLKNIES